MPNDGMKMRLLEDPTNQPSNTSNMGLQQKVRNFRTTEFLQITSPMDWDNTLDRCSFYDSAYLSGQGRHYIDSKGYLTRSHHDPNFNPGSMPA